MILECVDKLAVKENKVDATLCFKISYLSLSEFFSGREVKRIWLYSKKGNLQHFKCPIYPLKVTEFQFTASSLFQN